MGSRFRLRISKVIPSICCSKGHSRNNALPNPVLSQFSTVAPTVVPKPNPRRSSSLGRHVSRALTSCGLSPGSKPALSSDELEPTTCRLSQWRKEEKYWQVVEITETPRRKVYASFADENDNVVSPPPPSSADAETEKRHVCRQRRRVHLKPKNYETEALVSSSRSSSSDLKENDNEKDKTTTTRRRKKKNKKRTINSRSLSESEWSTPARLSVFQRMIPCRVEGKVRESFAVVKRSEDPYEDFKRSMAEMILEKQMFDDEDLEQLLHCFLSLNSKSHHGVIVEAFVEIWEALFSGSVRSTVSSSRRLSRSAL